jgi:hypothetical protein
MPIIQGGFTKVSPKKILSDSRSRVKPEGRNRYSSPANSGYYFTTEVISIRLNRFPASSYN